MASWIIYDSQSTEVSGFDLASLPPQSGAYISAQVQRKSNGTETVSLQAGPYVGALPLSTGDTLFIEPRAGRQALARMLSVTERVQDSTRREFDEYAKLGHAGETNNSWISLLSRSFIRQLRQIDKLSLRSDRVRMKDRGEFAKGRLDVFRTLVSVEQRQVQPVHRSFRQKTTQTAEHRFIGAAAGTLLNLSAVQPADIGVAARWAKFSDAQILTRGELQTVIRSLNAGHYTGPRSYYIRALVMAQLILLQGGVSLDSESVDTEALLTNIYSMFESYVRIVLRNALAVEGYVTEKLEMGTPTLFSDGTATLIPDAIISDATGIRILVDAKYKLNDAIGAGDYYQMASYLNGFKVNHGVIVRPLTGIVGAGMQSRQLRRGGFIHELNIGLDNWEHAEETLVDGIKQALAAS